MQDLLDTLIANGKLVLFLWVLAAQAGLPIPGAPILLAAGALAGAGRFDLATIVVLGVLASLLGDSAWFLLGRRRGRRVLALLCRISLEPDACVRSTETAFARNRAATLILAKFVPGLSTLAPPLAGAVGITWPRFLALDGLGALAWTLAYVLPGYALGDQLDELAANAATGGAWLFGALAAIVVAFVTWKFVRRRALLRELRIARIAPTELHLRLAAAEPPFVVDLRHSEDFSTDPRVIPGALRFTAEEIERRHSAIPRNRDVVLYCT